MNSTLEEGETDMLRDNILEEILSLPKDERRQLIEIITKSLDETPQEPLEPRIPGLSAHLEQDEISGGDVQKRILGLGKHKDFWMSEDFNDSLFPDNWMDDPSDPLNRSHDKKDADQ
jgi:hypothetical protein